MRCSCKSRLHLIPLFFHLVELHLKEVSFMLAVVHFCLSNSSPVLVQPSKETIRIRKHSVRKHAQEKLYFSDSIETQPELTQAVKITMGRANTNPERLVIVVFSKFSCLVCLDLKQLMCFQSEPSVFTCMYLA